MLGSRSPPSRPKEAKVAATEAEKSKEKAEELAYGLKVKLDKE